MKFVFTDKKVTLPASVHAYAEKKVGKLDRYFKTEGEASVVFSVEKDRNVCEITVRSGSMILRASESTSDMRASIDACVSGMERQIRKNKARLEKRLRTALPKTPRGELVGGAAVAAVLPLGTLAVTGLACWAAARLHPALGLALQMLWCGQALAAKGLAQESRNVYKELARGDLPAARRAVARIVGRDTQNLTAAGVTRAAVETVAENASDGVIAPLLYMLLGGAPLALTYKAINTMDSMLGYKNEKYLYFGRCAAKLDDAANWLPSRLAALLWVAAAALTGNSARGAWRIWRRDRRRHASPNSAQTESACAGALGVQLAGPAYYFGEYYDKPTIGDPLREIEPRDILRANRMMYAESLLALVLGLAVRLMLVL